MSAPSAATKAAVHTGSCGAWRCTCRHYQQSGGGDWKPCECGHSWQVHKTEEK